MDNPVTVWSYGVLALEQVATLPSEARSVIFSPDGNMLATAERNGELFLWNLNGEKLVWVNEATFSDDVALNAITFNADGSVIAGSDSLGNIYLWDVATGRRVVVSSDEAAIYNLEFSRDGKMLVAVSSNTNIRVWGVPLSTN